MTYLPPQCIAWQGEVEEPECQDMNAASPWARGWCTPATTALSVKSSQEKRVKQGKAISSSCCWDQGGVRRAAAEGSTYPAVCTNPRP